MSIQRKLSILTFVVVAFIAGVLFTTAGANLLGSGDRITTNTTASPVIDDQDRASTLVSPPPSVLEFENAFVSVADVINPVVVQIHSERVSSTDTQGQRFNPFEGTPFERLFPDDGGEDTLPNQEYRSQALGSGVIVRSDGYIVTNNHVIDGADELEVKLFDGSFYDATVVGTDPQSDLAVIRIDEESLPSIRYGEISNVRVGQWVLAFGSPLSEDLGNTVTSGIVSALGRTSANLSRLNLFSAFIQTDAAINPGNSGGPLVNLHGELIGINSAIYSRSGGNQGVGFAIPVDAVRLVADQLIDNGVVERGFLGVAFGPVSESLADALDVPRGAAQVVGITPGSAAEKAGIAEGDIILSVDGMQLMDYNQLPTIVANQLPGDVVKLEIVRDGKPLTKSVKLGRRDDAALAAVNPPDQDDSPSSMESLGLRLQDVTPEALAGLRVTQKLEGAFISRIDESSVAYREADLRTGDIIVELDRSPVKGSDDFARLFDRVKDGETVLVKVIRARNDQISTFYTALEKS
ncbi:MAG: Do family serine endopeptidase [Rhodothermales bacterium]|nr:Do family serine endopeptidase [Rhodothermales bacterium]